MCLYNYKNFILEIVYRCLYNYLVMIGLSCYHHLATLFLLQRVALSTAANMCKKLPSDAADFVMEAVPLLINLLNYHDSKVILFFAFNMLSLFF